ncbi:MAG: pilus assembly protein [Desulfuromonadaceae bacterium]|nr:pilus assembly protein [Desulfuromonadaceae bacterium]
MKRRYERGAAVVEFAVILPLLLTLGAGIVEFSSLYFNKQILATASREGARLGIVADTLDSEIRERVKKVCREEYNKGTPLIPASFAPILATYGTAIIDLPDADIVITRAGSGGFQEDLTVEVKYTYQFLLPAIIGLGNTKLLRSKTVMKIEDDPTP